MNDRKEWTVKIGGMTCDHCATSIDEALRRVSGVVESATSYHSGEARVVTDASVDGASLASAITKKGYRVLAQSRESSRLSGAAVTWGSTSPSSAAVRPRSPQPSKPRSWARASRSWRRVRSAARV